MPPRQFAPSNQANTPFYARKKAAKGNNFMYLGVLWCGTRKSGNTPPFSPIFQPICMQRCPLHIIREGKASKHAQSKLLIFFTHFTLFLPGFYLRNTLGLYFVATDVQ